MAPDRRRRRWTLVVRWVEPGGEHGGLRFVLRDWPRALSFRATCRRDGAETTIRLERVPWPWVLGDV
jgi:hypothetical protein